MASPFEADEISIPEFIVGKEDCLSILHTASKKAN